MEEIWLAKYTDHMYPEDNQIFAAYATEEEAQKRIVAEHAAYCRMDLKFPEMNTKKFWNYSTEHVVFINL